MFDGSVKATFTLPEVVDFVFTVSIIGDNGVVYTLSIAVAGLEIVFPTGFAAATRNVYVPAVNGICAFPVLDIVKMVVVFAPRNALEFPYVIPSIEYK